MYALILLAFACRSILEQTLCMSRLAEGKKIGIENSQIFPNPDVVPASILSSTRLNFRAALY